MTTKKCNKCGKDFDMWDKQEGFGFHYNVGYGSRFDKTIIDLDLCCDCFDSLMYELIPQCTYNPVTDT